ncbi:MAG: hypothetical protein WCC04_10710 [Terriglobales bacterium]
MAISRRSGLITPRYRAARPGYFFGEGTLAGQPLHMGSAATMTDCEIQRIDKIAMMDTLHREPTF